MVRRHLTRGLPRRAGVLAAGGVLALAGCAKDAELLTSEPQATAVGAPFLERYVALGNSITAGYQSGGINDSTQRRSYPNLLARAAGVRFAYPALAGRGCVPPLTNFLAQTRFGTGSTATTCDLRAGSSFTATLNNVAVPGANSFDPTGLAGGGYSALTQFFLGGRSQVERAIEANPTFATVWIGNNDVLGFAAAGTTTGVTPEATFRTNYAAMIDQLRAGSPELERGVLIGVADVTAIPLLVPAALLVPGSPTFSPVVRATVEQLVGRQLQLVNCPTTTQALVAFPFFAALRAQTQSLPAAIPAPFACGPITVPGVGELGTSGILDETERAFFVSRVAAYNAYIRAKADSIGFQYLDPNPTLLGWKASGQVPLFPDLTPANASRIFGRYFSLDGVHPSTAGHAVFADTLRLRINRVYGANLPAPDTLTLGRL
jgi:lysophospholipase L1-like esterase